MEELKIAIGDGFLESFSLIPKAKQKKVMEFLAKFRHNPAAGSINYEKLNDARDANFRSVRIDQDYRGIVLKPDSGSVYVLLWVDKHDDAYDWARRHRCNINPTTGVLQLFEVTQASAKATTPAEDNSTGNAPSKDTAPKLFELPEKTLLRLGVPKEHLEMVASLVTVEQLEALENTLPIEAFEALYLLAAGTPLAEILADREQAGQSAAVNTADFAQALQLDASKRRFCVVESELELMEMLEAPLEKWRVFLHPSQRKLVERRWNGPVRVLGGAGTGKTVVAMHRARWLASRYAGTDERILFTTFTSNLATDIRENLRKICSPAELERIEVRHIDEWIAQCLKRMDHPFRIVYPGSSDDYEQCWASAENLIPPSAGLPKTFFREEWERVVLPLAVTSRQAYLAVSRVGRGTALTRKQRADIWPVFEEMRIQLNQRRLTTVEDATYDIIARMQNGTTLRGYRSIIVDEGQDFGAEVFRLLRMLAPEAEDDLFIVGDGHQRIYRRKASLGRCGINIRGRGNKLRINYRTTEEIRRYAVHVLEGIEFDDMDDAVDGHSDYRSLIHGEPPIQRSLTSLDEEVGWIREQIDVLIAEGLLSQDICLVARTNEILDQIGLRLNQAGIDTRKLSRQSPDKRSVPGVRLTTMHRIKGLEFKAVFMAAINDQLVPLPLTATKTEDPVEARMHEINERALFHVAATRAVRHLYISSHGRPSPYLNQPTR